MTRDMRKLVEEGYETNDYVNMYRLNLEPNEMDSSFLKRFVELIPQHAKVLDLGSGCGIPYDRYLAKQGFDVTGMDISKKNVNLARTNVPEAKFFVGDFSKVNFDEDSFHAIVSFYAIFHIPRDEHKNLFQRMNIILKKEGVILVTLGTSNEECGIEENWGGAPMAWSSHEPDRAKEIICESGFKILEAVFEGQPGDNEYHLWILARKV